MFFGVSIGCMEASKRCFGVQGMLRNPFGGIRSNLEAFYEKQKFWFFFDFFKQKMKDFLMFWLDFWAWGCKKCLFSKNKSLIKNLIDRSFHLVLYFGPLAWWAMKWSLEKSFVLWILLKNAFFQALRVLKLEKWNFKSQNRFSQKFLGVSIGCMGASKGCFGVWGVFRNPFGGIRSNLKAFYENRKKKVQNPFFQAVFTA